MSSRMECEHLQRSLIITRCSKAADKNAGGGTAGKDLEVNSPGRNCLWKMNKEWSTRHRVNTKCVNVIGYHLVAYMVHIQIQSV